MTLPKIQFIERFPGPTFSEFSERTEGAEKLAIEHFFHQFPMSLIAEIAKRSTSFAREKNPDAETIMPSDMLQLLAVQIYMGICKLPRARDHFSRHWLLGSATLAENVMSRNKFMYLTASLHFHG
jgi:hypothetical protein